MSRLPRIYASWFLIACSLFVTVLLPVVGQGGEESQRVELLPDPTATHSWHELAAPPRIEDSTFYTSATAQTDPWEDPPDLIRTAVDPRIFNPTTSAPEPYGQPAAPARFPSRWPNMGVNPGTNPFQNQYQTQYSPQPQPQYPNILQPAGRPQLVAPPVAPSQSETPSPQLKISSRYSDPNMLRFLERSSLQSLTAFYMEAAQLIDTRHVQPPSYEQRVQAAIAGLQEAVGNPAFLRAAGANANPQQIEMARGELGQLVTQSAASANEAVGVMQWSAEIVSRQLGGRREAAAFEFLNATLDSLDKFSSFVPAKTAMAPSASLEENIVGIGIELKAHEQGALILGVIEGGSAAQIGLTKGDVLIAVDGRSIAGLSLSQAADLISGPAGSKVNIHIRRNGQRYGADLIRRKVYVSSVSGAQMVDSSIGYLRLKQFSESSAEDMEKSMWELYRQGMRSLVLDLRGNPGGLLTESVEVSDLFLPDGVIVSTRGRTSQDNTEERAKFEKTWNLPLVVLVDENSASASEIFAAAVQDNQRGVIVGRHSYGKGTVQTHFPLRSVEGTLKLTTAKFYSPAGREMAGQGVSPDLPVAQSNSDSAATVREDFDVQAAIQTIQTGAAAQLAGN